MNIREYIRPKSLGEAYEHARIKGNALLSGGAFLNLTASDIDTLIDLSDLGLSFIRESGDCIEIGAATTLRSIEKSHLLKDSFDGILAITAASIMGVQVRNIATIGGTIWGRYGFSDMLTSLLALGTSIELYNRGVMALEEFLESEVQTDILTKVIIRKEEIRAHYTSLRNTSTDFSILNAAVSRKDNKFRICVGSRPGRAVLVKEGAAFLENSALNEETALHAGEIVSESIMLGSDIRASAEYRKELCKILVKRCIMEVIQ